MPIANGLSNNPASEQGHAQVARALSWLKAEQNAAETPPYSSLLLHESAVIEEAVGESAEAAKNYRAALALDPDHRESIERLIAIAERHQQLDDLDVLYEQLATAADNTEERARATLELAFVALRQEGGATRALDLLREVVTDSPADAAAWLLIDLIADRQGDREAREQALEAQLRLTQHPHFRGMLLLEWTKLCEQANDPERCFNLLDAVVQEASSATYLALLERERIAQKCHRPTEYRAAIEQRIRLVKQAIIDKNSGDALGVLHQHRNATALGCLEVLASLACAQAGDHADAQAHLSDAEDRLPGDLCLKYLSWLQAERSQDWERFVELGESLARSATGAAAAWLWLRLATARWRLGDAAAARRFVALGLGADRKSLALRAFDIHLAICRDDRPYLGVAVEAAAECLETEAEKAEWLLAAAGLWALVVQDGESANAAISGAFSHGLESSVAHQASRLLATWSNDWDLYDVSTSLAQNSASTPIERVDLLLELLRVRLLKRDTARALSAIRTLAKSEDAAILGCLVEATLGNCLRRRQDAAATAPGANGPAERIPIDWEKLAEDAGSTELAHALQLGSAVDLLLANDNELAARRLDDLGTQDPSNLVVMAARSAFALRAGNIRETTSILSRTADCVEDASLRATLAFEGLWLGIREGCLDDVPQLLDLANLSHPEATSALSRWILRLASDRAPDLADRVLEASRGQGSPTRRALEKLGLSLARGDWQANIDVPETDPEQPVSGLSTAVALLETISQTPQNADARAGAPLAAANAALEYLARWGDGSFAASASPLDRLSDARDWANQDPSLVAQLEWLLVCCQTDAAQEEADARDRVAAKLGPKDAEALRVSAHLGRFLASSPQRPLLATTASAASRLANLEVSLPGCDPRRRATAIEEAGGLLGAASTPSLKACLGFNQIASGDTDSARRTLSELVETQPRSLAGWLGLRLLAELSTDHALLAQATSALGDLFLDPKDASAEWERAADLLLDELADPVRGRAALERAVALDVTRDKAFHRLFRIVRDAKQPEQLLSLIEARLPQAKTEDESLMLNWERARCMRSLGDREGALLALDAVSAIDPHHVGALALAGEINIALGRFSDAARFLSQLARQSDAPQKQRLMGGLAAAELFDKKLNRPVFAQDILLELHRGGLSTDVLRERLSALAIRTKSYQLAVEILEILMAERTTAAGRADAARLALVLLRDHMKQPERAVAAVARLLVENPCDTEAIALVLTGCFDVTESNRWLHEAGSLLRQALIEQPLDTAALETLANISRWFDDLGTLETCLSALVCLGAGTAAIAEELAAIDAHAAHVPTMAIDETTLRELCAPEDTGPVAALFQQFSEVFAEALGPTLSVLGVTRKQRVDPRAGLPLRNEIVAWAGAFGVAEFDLYLAERVAGDAIAIPGERPSLVVASGMTAPLDARSRQAVARELIAVRRGTCLLRHRSASELAALVVACCQIGGHPLRAPSYAVLDEFVRAVTAALPRRLRKALTDHAQAIHSATGGEGSVDGLLRAALDSQDRAAALAAGDVSHVLSHVTTQGGRPATTNELRERMARLLSFALSQTYLDLKDKLGLSVR
jgi:cellulose synthase operon protein C